MSTTSPSRFLIDEQAIDLDSAIDALTKTARELLADSDR
jgi:hypothetical protein